MVLYLVCLSLYCRRLDGQATNEVLGAILAMPQVYGRKDTDETTGGETHALGACLGNLL